MDVPHIPGPTLLTRIGSVNSGVEQVVTYRADEAVFCVALIDTRRLLGEVLIAALKLADATANFILFPSVSAWLKAPQITHQHVVLLSVDPQPGRTLENCLDDLQMLRKAAPDTPVIVVSSEDNPDSVNDAMELGVNGYVCTNLHIEAMMRIIRLVQAGDRYVPASSFQALMRRPASNAENKVEQSSYLSQREMLVAKALRRGTPNKVIAYELNMCESTVKVHVRHIMKKLKAKNRTQVAFLTNKMFND